jgi:putative hydrolase of the HAD superfamily
MEIREQGIRISILSDFPVGGKLETLGIADLVDFSCCSEESGYLKPHPAPFLYVARHMNVPCDRILFAGDSYEKDILGASNVGMKTALFSERAHSPSVRRHMQKTCPKADLIYADYHELPQCMVKLLEEEDA